MHNEVDKSQDISMVIGNEELPDKFYLNRAECRKLSKEQRKKLVEQRKPRRFL